MVTIFSRWVESRYVTHSLYFHCIAVVCYQVFKFFIIIGCAPISICSHLKNVHSVSLQGSHSKWLFYIVGHFNLMTLKTTNIALHYALYTYFIHWHASVSVIPFEGNVNDMLYFLINTGLTKDIISWCLVHFSKLWVILDLEKRFLFLSFLWKMWTIIKMDCQDINT